MKDIPDEEYKKILELMPICCVESMIVHDGKVLLIKRKTEPFKDDWWFPGGRVRKHETLEGAAERKTLEETGITAKFERKVGTYETTSEHGPYENIKGGVHTINTCILLRVTDENPIVKLDDTSLEYRWIDKIEDDLHPYMKNVLRESNVFNEE